MSYDAIVVGAGLPGVMAAWRLAEGGFDVAVFDRKHAAAESSALAAGHVPQDSLTAENLAILRRTRAIVDELDEITNGVTRFHVVGGIQLATGVDGSQALHNRARLGAELGVGGELLAPGEIARRWPALSTADLSIGYQTLEDGFVRSLDLTIVLGAMARNAGADICEGCPVDAVRTGDGRVVGVEVGGELISAPRVLVAAGAWSRPLLETSGVFLPTKSYVLQAVMLADADVDLPFMNEVEAEYYLIQRSKTSVLLGLPPTNIGEDADRFPREPDPRDQRKFLQLLRIRVPRLADARAAGGWAGVLVAAPDAGPLLGPFGPDGLFVATAFGGGGLQRVSAAEAVSEVMLGVEPFFNMTSMAASRFDGYGGESFEFKQEPFYYVDAQPVEARWRASVEEEPEGVM